MPPQTPKHLDQSVDIRPKIHSLSDDALRNLSANAHRLENEGTPTQRLQAHDLIPAIDAELFMRRSAVVKVSQTIKATARKRK